MAINVARVANVVLAVRRLGALLNDTLSVLGIDEDTQSSIRAIVDGSHTTGREIRQSLDQAEQEMRGLLQQETPDKDAVLHQAEKIGMLRIKEQQNRLQAMLQIRGAAYSRAATSNQPAAQR